MSERISKSRPATCGAVPPSPASATVPSPSAPAGGRGFTLVELLVVIVIISILLGFILNASMGSVRAAQQRATQALITKLETGLNDRLDALMQNRPDPNTAHKVLAAINPTNLNRLVAGDHRSQVIAWYDYIKRQMPDTFYVQTDFDPNYPLNFAASPYPLAGGTPTDNNSLGTFVLPMGNSVAAPYGDGSGTGYSLTNNTGLMEYNPAGDGIYGAAYTVAAGLYKNLGYMPQGYDSVDNNHNGMIDEYAEGAPDKATKSLVNGRLGNHTHVTARAEMLYALLVEGGGPLGSVFNADEFTDKEVQDTDGDGLPEFIDAWGNPLQFFRWPILYHSDLQRGQVITATGGTSWTLSPPYATIYEQREQDPLDLNQQLVAPAWWFRGNNSLSYFGGYPTHDQNLGVSESAQAFEFYFHRLTDPLTGTAANAPNYWNRTATFYHYRRAFYSKFLILSGGLDGQPGVFLYDDSRMSPTGSNSLGSSRAWALIANENNAMPFSATDSTSGGPTVDFTVASQHGAVIPYTQTQDPTTPSTGDLIQAGQDDITNQNQQSSGGIGGGS